MNSNHWKLSMVALAWIKTNENWNTFVRNRVKEVRSCEVNEWHHKPGNMYPADNRS